MVEAPDVLEAFDALGFTGPTWARHRVLYSLRMARITRFASARLG